MTGEFKPSGPFSAEHWSEIESLTASDALRVQEDALRDQIGYLSSHSEFYRDKLAAAGVAFDSIQSVEDLARVPFTTKQDLRDSLATEQPLGRHRAAPIEDIIQIQASSGTTGSPSYVGLTRSDITTWCELGARAFYANGLRPGDVCLHAFGMSKGFVGGLPISQIVQYMSMCEVPIGAEAGVDRLLRVLADVRPDVLLGTPYFVTYMAEQCEAHVGSPADQHGVRAVSVGGEPGGGIEPVRRRIVELWGAEVREMLGGTDLACTYWGECEQKDGMHFLSPDLMIAELIDPETGEVMSPAEGAEGELVYTALARRASPVLRFRTGDHVVVTGVDCGCGRTGYKIRCVGRTDDMLIVRGINLFPSAVKDLVMKMVPETSGELRIVADFEGHTTQSPLKLRVEAGAVVAATDYEGLAGAVEERVRNALAVKAVVEIVPPDSLEKPGVKKVALVERPS